MQKERDEYNLEHVAKINTKIQKRVAKYNEKLGFTPPDQNAKRNSARGDKSLRMMNENGVPHNLKYGKWHFGKVHTFRGNITCSPVAGTPVVSGTTVIKPVSALQYVSCSIISLLSFLVCYVSVRLSLSLSYPSIAACLHSLIPHDTSLTIIPPFPPQSIINRHNAHIT